MARSIVWGFAFFLWLVFTFWYTNTGGPLTDDEVEMYVDQFAQSNNSADVDRLRAFLETDTGNQFIMVNIIDMADNPPDVAGAEPGESAASLMGRYMEYMWPALLSRACHPIYAGGAVANAMDLAGIEGAQVWDQGALMRYRSRRDLMEISANPVFADRHDFKVASLDKTIAFPVENSLYYSDPRFLLALILFVVASLIDLVIWRR